MPRVGRCCLSNPSDAADNKSNYGSVPEWTTKKADMRRRPSKVNKSAIRRKRSSGRTHVCFHTRVWYLPSIRDEEAARFTNAPDCELDYLVGASAVGFYCRPALRIRVYNQEDWFIYKQSHFWTARFPSLAADSVRADSASRMDWIFHNRTKSC